MKLGTEDKKKMTMLSVAGVGALIAAYFLYGEIFGGPTTPPPAPAVVLNQAPTTPPPVAGKTVVAPPGFAVGAAQKLGTTSGQLDPTLHMEAMLRTEALVYTGTGRNIFSGAAPPPPPVAIAVNKFPPRPVAPLYTPPPPPPGPPPPPPINLKFFGTATTASGVRKAFLLNGDDVYLALAGDVVQKRYRIVSIAANSITVEDIPNTNKQTLPLLAQP